MTDPALSCPLHRAHIGQALRGVHDLDLAVGEYAIEGDRLVLERAIAEAERVVAAMHAERQRRLFVPGLIQRQREQRERRTA